MPGLSALLPICGASRACQRRPAPSARDQLRCGRRHARHGRNDRFRRLRKHAYRRVPGHEVSRIRSGKSLFFGFGNLTFALSNLRIRLLKMHLWMPNSARFSNAASLLRHQTSALCSCRCRIATISFEGRERVWSGRKRHKRSEPRHRKIKDALLTSGMPLSAHRF